MRLKHCCHHASSTLASMDCWLQSRVVGDGYCKLDRMSVYECLFVCLYGWETDDTQPCRKGNEGILRESGLEEERIENVVCEVTG